MILLWKLRAVHMPEEGRLRRMVGYGENLPQSPFDKGEELRFPPLIKVEQLGFLPLIKGD